MGLSGLTDWWLKKFVFCKIHNTKKYGYDLEVGIEDLEDLIKKHNGYPPKLLKRYL